MTLLERLRSRILDTGPLAFEEFMDSCLYDERAGFFGSGPMRSVKAGDFLTSPEVSSAFGRAFGRFTRAAREKIPAAPFVVADIGAGSGSLLSSLVAELAAPEVAVWAVDVSPAARKALGGNAGWHVGSRLDDLPGCVSGVIVANELLDNLPVSLVVRAGDGWEERRVGVTKQQELVLVEAPARPEISEWADRFGGIVPDGGMVEVQIAAGRWLQNAMARLERGVVVVVDYGGTTEELEPRRTRGTLRTYRAHHLGPDPLLQPGTTDITVDVNFTALAAIAHGLGAQVEVQRQDDFLAVWGLREEVRELRHRELEAARGPEAMERLQLRSERADAETLLHPRGLGDFRVLTAWID